MAGWLERFVDFGGSAHAQSPAAAELAGEARILVAAGDAKDQVLVDAFVELKEVARAQAAQLAELDAG